MLNSFSVEALPGKHLVLLSEMHLNVFELLNR